MKTYAVFIGLCLTHTYVQTYSLDSICPFRRAIHY